MRRGRLRALGWNNLTHDPRRLVVAAAGIAFAVVLIAMELGFRFALLDSVVELIRQLDADLIVVSANKSTMASPAPFSRRVLDETRAFDRVAKASALYIESSRSVLRNPDVADAEQGVTARKIRVIAFDPADRPLLNPAVNAQARALGAADTALLDDTSDPSFGRFAPGRVTSLARRPVRVIGSFRLGTDLVNDGNMIMSDQNFLRFFPDARLRPPDLRLVELGLLKLDEGADPLAVRDRLQEALRDQGIKVFTKADFYDREYDFWNTRTPIGMIFALGAMLGVVVGAVICYQILSSDIADHLAEYATLKAMGYNNVALVGIVVQEAVVLSLIGFAPGIAIAGALYATLARSTGLLMELTPGRAALMLSMTVAMCLGSGLFAVRKVLSADPAGLF